MADIEYDFINTEYAKIGHEINAQTLFPEAYIDPNSDIFYCDCPGFFDTREVEEKITISINLEMAIQNANAIKAIIVTINHSDLMSTRGKNFIDLYKTLDQLISIENCSNSIIFVITRCPANYKLENFINFLQSVVISTEDYFRNRPNTNKRKEIKEKERMLKIIGFILANRENILIGDLSSNQLQNSILSIQSKANNINKNLFSFDSYDEYRVIFNDLMNQLIYQSLVNLRVCVEYPSEIESIFNNIEELKKTKKNLEMEEPYIASKNKKVAMLMQFNESIKYFNQDLELINVKLKSLENEIERVSNERKALDSDEPFLVKKIYYSDKRWSIVGRYSNSKKLFKYHDPETPLIKVLKSCKNGKFTEEKNFFDKGFYSVKYISESGKDGLVEIFLYAMGKYRKGYQIRIKYLDDVVLKELFEIREETLKSKNNLLNELDEIQKSIQNIQENNYEGVDAKFKIDFCNAKISSYEKSADKYIENLENAIVYLKREKENIDTIEFIIKALKLNTTMTEEFLIFYNKYQNEKPNEKLSLRNNLDDLSSNKLSISEFGPMLPKLLPTSKI